MRRSFERSPLAQASKNSATVAACRFSISAFSARQLGKPCSRATSRRAVASFVRGSRRRSSANRSRASFFRYSSEGRSGSLEFDIDAFLPFFRPASPAPGRGVAAFADGEFFGGGCPPPFPPPPPPPGGRRYFHPPPPR